jgi:hypothetical protein
MQTSLDISSCHPTVLTLLPDFLAQQQSEVRESRETAIRVKLMTAAQQTINC